MHIYIAITSRELQIRSKKSRRDLCVGKSPLMMRAIVIALTLLLSPCMGRRLGWASLPNSPPPPTIDSFDCTTSTGTTASNCSGIVFPFAGGYGISVRSISNFTDGSDSTQAAIYKPTYLATYGSLLYIADNAGTSNGIFVVYPNHTIYAFAGVSASGSPSTVYSTPPSGPATSIKFTVAGMCTDPTDGTMYVSDSNSYFIYKISQSMLTTFAGTGSSIGYNNQTGVPPTSVGGYIPGNCRVSLSGDVYFSINQDSTWGLMKVSKSTGLMERIYYCVESDVGT